MTPWPIIQLRDKQNDAYDRGDWKAVHAIGSKLKSVWKRIQKQEQAKVKKSAVKPCKACLEKSLIR